MNKEEKKTFYHRLKIIALPMALQQFMIALVSASDAIMLGFLNQDSMSAVSLAGQVQFVYSLFLFATISGVSIFAAQYWGINDRESVEKIFALGLKISVLLSLPFTLGAIICPNFLMRAFASDTVLIEYGADYLRVVGISYLFLSISQIYLCILKNCGQAFKCAVISSASVVINIVLNALLIFGIGFFPKMGIEGAALATVISKLVELVWTLAIMFKRDSIKLRPKYLIRNDKVLEKDFWKYSLPILGNQIVWGVGFTVYSGIMGHMGSDAAAANSIANIAKNLIICLCCGVASASGVMVGNLLGRGELEKAKAYGIKLTKISILSGIGSGLIVLCIIPFVPLFSSLSSSAQGYLRVMLIVSSYYVIGKSINMTVIAGILPSGGDSKFGFKCDAITMWAVTVPLGLICAFLLKLPVTTVYIIINVDEIIKLPAVFRNFKKYRWVQNLTKTGNTVTVEG